MNTNKNLPANAISTTKVEAGMQIRYPYDGDGVHNVIAVQTFGDRVIITTDKGRKRCNAAGTVRLVQTTS